MDDAKLKKAEPIVKQNGGKRGVALTKDQINGAIEEMIGRHVVQLSEHASSVQIICTKVESNGSTTLFTLGVGDIYARVKACETYLCRMNGGC